MRGPGFRRDLDVRRLWRCPGCGVERRLSGEHTSLRCHCRPEGVWMQIVGERNAVPRAVSVMSAPEIPVADFQLTEEELAKPLEGRVRRRNPFRGAAEESPNDRKPHGRERDGKSDQTPATDAERNSPDMSPESDGPDAGPTHRRPRRDRKLQQKSRPSEEITKPETTPFASMPDTEQFINEAPPEDDAFAAGLD